MDLRIAKQGTGWFVLIACALIAAAVTFTIGAITASNATAQSFLPIYEKGTAAFEEEFSIGGDIDDDDYFLFSPTDLALDSEGNLYILDYKGFCIKKFDHDGKFIKSFGRKGEGPGEMLAAYDMAMDPEGHIVIYDFQNSSRFSVFDTEGAFLKSFTLSEMGFRSLASFGFALDGAVYASIDFTDYSQPDGKTKTTIAKIDPVKKTETAIDSASTQKWYAAQSGESVMMISAPFCPELLWGSAPSGNVIVANSDDYAIRIYSPALELIKETKHDAEKPKVTDADKEEYLSAWEDEDSRLLAKKRARFPKYKPYFDTLLIDHEGYMLFRTGETEGDISVYNVFTPDGKFINTLKMPLVRGSAILVDGVVYNIERHEGESDPTVHRYRVR